MSSNGRAASLSSPPSGDAETLGLYLDELGRYPLLSPEREREVARRARGGDGEAFDTLVRSNLRFVVSVAKRYRNQGLSFADLVQEGNLGLIRAAERFDPEQGVKFISYAVWWIRQAILAALAEQGRSVRLPPHRATEVGRMVRVREELRQSLGRPPTSREVAREADLEVPTIEMLQVLNTAEVRLDAPVAGEGASERVDRFLVDEADVEKELEAQLLYEQVRRAVRTLRPREARIVRLYYGLQGEHEHTLEEIGQLLGVTRERIRQLRDRALRELKHGELGAVLRTYAA